MRVDFPKKNYVHLQKQKCGISNDVFFFCGSGTAKIQVTDCSGCESKTAELRDIVHSLCGSGTSSRRIFHVWKRKCSHIIVCVRKRNFKSHNNLYMESLWFLIQ